MARSISRGACAFTVALALTLAACSNSGDDDSAGGNGGGGDVSLRVAWYGGEARHAKYNTILDAYESAHEGVSVSREGAEWGAYWERVGTQTAARDNADLLHFTDMQLTEFAQNGVLLDLTPYIESGDLDLSDFDQTLLEAGVVDGGTYGIPTGMLALSSIINEDMMTEGGVQLPPEDEMWTWEEFADNGRTVSEALGDERWFTQDMAGSTRAFRAFLLAQGKDLFDYGADPVALNFEEADLVEWLTYWEDLRQDGVAPPATFTSEESGLPFEDQALSRDVVGIQLHTSNSLTNHAPYTEGELTLRPMPRGNDGTAGDYAFSVLMAVASSSANPDEAVDLLSYFLTDPEIAVMYRNEFGPYASESMREAVSGELTDEETIVVDYSELALNLGLAPSPPWPAGGVVLNEGLLSRANEQVAFGEASPEDAAATFFSEAANALG